MQTSRPLFPKAPATGTWGLEVPPEFLSGGKRRRPECRLWGFAMHWRECFEGWQSKQNGRDPH